MRWEGDTEVEETNTNSLDSTLFKVIFFLAGYYFKPSLKRRNDGKEIVMNSLI